MFLKAIASLGMCSPLEELRRQDMAAIKNLRFSVEEVEQAYRSRYDTVYWDTHCQEPRGRGGRHAAFIKHNCWFYTDSNPSMRLQAADWQVQALTRFRVGTHRLRCNEHTLPLTQRTCQLCDGGRLEDEVHVMLECEAYSRLRNHPRWSHLFREPLCQDMKAFMCQEDQYVLSAFVHAVTRERQRLLDNMHVDLVDPVLP